MILLVMKTLDTDRTAPFSPSLAFLIGKIGLLIIAITCVCSTALFADDYTDAMKRAKAEDKAVILYFYSKYCGYCEMMRKQTLSDKEVAATMKNDLVSLKVDVDARSDLAAKYRIRGYPTTDVLDPTGRNVVGVPGYLDKKEFKAILAFAKGKAYKTMSLREYFKKAGVRLE